MNVSLIHIYTHKLFILIKHFFLNTLYSMKNPNFFKQSMSQIKTAQQ